MGVSESQSSFLLRPLYPNRNSKVETLYQVHQLFSPVDSTSETSSSLEFAHGKAHLTMLPASYQIQTNSKVPYGWGDGAMITNKGFQSLLTVGFYLEAGFIRAQFRPEYVFAQNANFEGFPSNYSSELWQSR
ncbi:MAG: hypothetical protein RIC15_02415, partial [Vicingaceae bacterium]